MLLRITETSADPPPPPPPAKSFVNRGGGGLRLRFLLYLHDGLEVVEVPGVPNPPAQTNFTIKVYIYIFFFLVIFVVDLLDSPLHPSITRRIFYVRPFVSPYVRQSAQLIQHVQFPRTASTFKSTQLIQLAQSIHNS